jgi:hypothetical protein
VLSSNSVWASAGAAQRRMSVRRTPAITAS